TKLGPEISLASPAFLCSAKAAVSSPGQPHAKRRAERRSMIAQTTATRAPGMTQQWLGYVTFLPALLECGDRDNDMLRKSAAAYRQVLQSQTRTRVLLDDAQTQDSSD